MTASTITPAMREWCRRLSKPERCTWHKPTERRLDVSARGSQAGRPTYVMAEKMLDAGLIKFEPREVPEYRSGDFVQPAHREWVAVLTEAGLAARPKVAT